MFYSVSQFFLFNQVNVVKILQICRQIEIYIFSFYQTHRISMNFYHSYLYLFLSLNILLKSLTTDNINRSIQNSIIKMFGTVYKLMTRKVVSMQILISYRLMIYISAILESFIFFYKLDLACKFFYFQIQNGLLRYSNENL